MKTEFEGGDTSRVLAASIGAGTTVRLRLPMSCPVASRREVMV